MSRTIWTRCGGRASARPLELRAWRVVEAQHRTATLRLVDSLAEQEVLEGLIEGQKPPLPSDPSFERLHYLLATPFRYPPLRWGSRFGTRFERGLWYGSRAVTTALAEVAYYRLLFLEGTAARIEHVATEHSAFTADVRTRVGVDLTRPRFRRWHGEIFSPTSYAASQSLGRAMRDDGVQAFVYRSARDPEGGDNVGLFTPAAFARRRPGPRALPTWHCTTTPASVIFRRRDLLRDHALAFPRETFLVDGRLPVPGCEAR